jgi:membrane fusion protein, multidrug efflux system
VPTKKPLRLLLALAAVLVALLLQCACRPGQDRDQARERPAVRVETAQVRAEDIVETLQGIGSIEASEMVIIRSEISGVIAEVRFEEGSRVSEGDVLYVLRDEKLRQELEAGRSSLRAARASLEQARQTFERFDTLFEDGLISAEEHKRTKTDLETARAEVQRLSAQVALQEEQLRETVVSAPMDGVLSQSLLDPGSYVGGGEELATLYTETALRVAFMVPESGMGRVRTGQPATTFVPAVGDERFEGQVVFVSPSIDVRTRKFLVRASVKDASGVLKPGAFASAEVAVEVRRQRPTVPEGSLVAAREGYFVYVVDARDTAQRKDVAIGSRQAGLVEIVEGLEPGEIIVSTGQMQLSDGDPVQVVAGPTPDGSTEAATTGAVR